MRRELQSPEQRAIFDERRRARNQAKCAKKRAKRRAERQASLQSVPMGLSKTDPIYRRRLPPVPEMESKADLRAFLAQAVRNTAEMRP